VKSSRLSYTGLHPPRVESTLHGAVSPEVEGVGAPILSSPGDLISGDQEISVCQLFLYSNATFCE
jgi:hypothetical protein